MDDNIPNKRLKANTQVAKYVGVELGRLRRRSNITGSNMAIRMDVSQSQVSKIEHGQSSISWDTVTQFLKLVPHTTKDLRKIELLFAEAGVYRGEIKLNMEPGEWRNALKFETKSQQVRVYSNSVIPMHFHTAKYHAALMTKYRIGNDVIISRLKSLQYRQDILWKHPERYTILMSEAGLYSLVTSIDDHMQQLDRLERMLYVPNLRIGIIPTIAGFGGYIVNTLGLYDNTQMIVEVINGEALVDDKSSILDAIAMLDRLEELACFNEHAIPLVVRAKQYFSDNSDSTQIAER